MTAFSNMVGENMFPNKHAYTYMHACIHIPHLICHRVNLAIAIANIMSRKYLKSGDRKKLLAASAYRHK